MNPKIKHQAGFMLLETMVGLLLFSIGILGMVSMLVMSMKASSEASYRSEASYLANQILAQMWVDRANLTAYALNPTNPVESCPAGTSASGNANVTNWLLDVAKIPNGNALQPQILVDPLNNNTVTVTLCWQSPNTPVHKFVVTAAIN